MRKSPPPPLCRGRRSDPLSRGGARLARGGIFLGAFLLPLLAHAALFDDEEARRQIVQLRNQVESRQKSIEERLSAIDARLAQMDSSGQNRAVDLAQLLDSLKQDLAKLRGQVEVLANQTEILERRQKELYVDLDNRLRRLEQTQSQLQDKLSQGERSAASEKQAYEAALNQFKLGNYQLAITSFQSFMTNFASSELVPSAQYWIGNAHAQYRELPVGAGTGERRARDAARARQEVSLEPGGRAGQAAPHTEVGGNPVIILVMPAKAGIQRVWGSRSPIKTFGDGFRGNGERPERSRPRRSNPA